MRPTSSTDDRGQAHTVEAFIAALLLISGLLFAMQATAVTPLSASTSNQHIENQQRALAGDLLSTADEDGTLKAAALYWNTSGGGFEETPDGETFYQNAGSQTAFLDSLQRTLSERRIAYNIVIRYHVYNEEVDQPEQERVTMVRMGQPSDNAVTASRTITLSETDRLTGEDDCQLTNSDCAASFYAPNFDADSQFYNRLEVRITTWRM